MTAPTPTAPIRAQRTRYRAEVDVDRALVRVTGSDGRPWFDLRPAMLADTTSTVDESIGRPVVEVRSDEPDLVLRFSWRSSVWEQRWTELRCATDTITVRGGVVGHGRIREVHLLADRRAPLGFLPSGVAVRSTLSPNPDHPRRTVKHAGESAVIGVVGAGSEPGVGRWLFTPAPWCVAVCRDPSPDDVTPAAGEWAYVGVSAPVHQQNWTELHVQGGSDALSLRLDYQGHTEVDGSFDLPEVVLGFGSADPYAAVAAYCARESGRGSPTTGPAWWRQPMFCGWGAQIAAAERGVGRAADQCTEANYDAFLGRLNDASVEPGTVVIDDKWAEKYATCLPDTGKWPDLRGWIAARHAEGRRVLLWWKAWDTEGAPAAGCIRTVAGDAVALDPGSALGRTLVRQAVTGMLSPAGLDADGLKIDFTASTPSGFALTGAGPFWGSALLHELLALVHDAAKAVKPDALIITHTPNPAFADVGDVLRLNDATWLDAFDPSVDVVHQMSHRARIAAAAWPGREIDTDGWFMPDPQSWRRYARVQPALGIPALYYAGEFDGGNGAMTPADLALVADVWRRYRTDRGLPDPGRTPKEGGTR